MKFKTYEALAEFMRARGKPFIAELAKDSDHKTDYAVYIICAIALNACMSITEPKELVDIVKAVLGKLMVENLKATTERLGLDFYQFQKDNLEVQKKVQQDVAGWST